MINIESVKKAIVLTQMGRYNEAEQLYLNLLEKNPNESALLSAFGLFYVDTGNYDKAVEYLKKACKIKETLGTVASLGFAEYERGNYQQSAEILEHSLEFGENADIYNKLILSLFEIKSFKKAIEFTEKMCELYPDDSRTVANKVKMLVQTGKLLEAEKVCVEYLKENSENAILWYHLGLLKELIYSDDKSAIECYKLAGERGNLGADYNIAVAYKKLGEFSEAEKYYKKFLKIMPNDEEGMTALGMLYLEQKKFKEGYELFYKRKKGKIDSRTNNLWQAGTPLDKDLLVICDQGLGDHIQFVRYLPFLQENHNVTVTECKQLRGLFEENYPDIKFIDIDDIAPNVQAVRITDLAYILDMDFDNIPFSEGYLNSQAANIKNDKLKVGLCWEAGAAGIRGMINRTIHVKCFEPFFNLENIQTYSFQYTDTFKGNEKYPQMINLAYDFKDFSDTAKALKAMDIVVTVDTCITHLAGALGIKTFLLLPYAPDWRWFNSYKETPWYKSVEIFRQTDHISWEKPINEIATRLNAKN